MRSLHLQVIGNNHVGNTAQGTNGTSDNSQASNTPGERPTKGHMVIPYIQDLGKASSTDVVSIVFKHILKATGPSSKNLSNQGQGP